MKTKKYYISFLYIFVFILTLSFSLLFCEAVARIFRLSRTYNSYPRLAGDNRAPVYSSQKNSLGWRDREFSREKEEGVFRIACIGDSVTEGYGVAQEDTFPKVLEGELKKPGYKVEVMNLGKCANNTSDNLTAIKQVLEFHPDLIILQWGLNDIEGLEHREFVSANDKEPEESVLARLRGPLRKSVLYLALAERYNYLKLRLGLRNWAFDEWRITPRMWEKEFTRLKAGLSGIDNHKVLICYFPYDFQIYSTRKEVFVAPEMMEKFCRDNGYRFIDFTGVFKKDKNMYGIFIDDAHLSRYGHKVAADYLERFISGERAAPAG